MFLHFKRMHFRVYFKLLDVEFYLLRTVSCFGTNSTLRWNEQYLALVSAVPCVGIDSTLRRYRQYQALILSW